MSTAVFDGLPATMTFDSCGTVCVNVTIMNDLVLEKTENISVILKTNDSWITLEQEKTDISIFDNEGITYCWCDKCTRIEDRYTCFSQTKLWLDLKRQYTRPQMIV